ncbi:MAG: peptidoglycan-associated lipoprotein Pal [Gemmatimonadales bacterium]
MSRVPMKSAIVTAIVAIAACGGDPPPPPAPTPPPAQAAAPAPRPPAPTNNNAADAARQREAALAQMRATLAEMVFFDYDRSDIRADSRAVLDRKARVLRDEPTVRIRIEGHADERGSTEYNLALGSRRAEAVRGYLTGLGIQAARIEIVSFGEGRPLERMSNESSWSRNRRAEFAVTAGSLQAGG